MQNRTYPNYYKNSYYGFCRYAYKIGNMCSAIMYLKL